MGPCLGINIPKLSLWTHMTNSNEVHRNSGDNSCLACRLSHQSVSYVWDSVGSQLLSGCMYSCGAPSAWAVIFAGQTLPFKTKLKPYIDIMYYIVYHV